MKMVSAVALINGLCWLADFFIFLLINALIGMPGLSNFIGNLAGLSLSYGLNIKFVFRKNLPPHLKSFAYIFFTLLVSVGFSFLLDFLVHSWDVTPILAKLIVTPCNFAVNLVSIFIFSNLSDANDS